MKKFLISLIILAMASCIENDIPYPVIPAGISALDIEGAGDISIDGKARTVSVLLEEATDIHNVNIRSVEFFPDDASASFDITGIQDMSHPIKLTVSSYQDYSWIVSASQNIVRRFRLQSQIGEAVIDVANRRVIAKVPSKADLAHLNIAEMKLGPENISTYSPAPEDIHDFNNGAKVEVKYRDITEVWTLFAERSTVNVELNTVDAWSRISYFEARGVPGAKCGFRMRKKGDTDWTAIAATADGKGAFEGYADNLEPETGYEVMAWSGKDETGAEAFVTEGEMQLPNSGFETWSHAESGKYFSFYDPDAKFEELKEKWWDSGNNGSTTVGSSFAITMPDTADKVEGNSSAKLASAYVIIKFAAGNIFSGQYYKTLGTTGGVIRLGRPFTFRPRKLTLQLKYKSGKISSKTLGDKPEGDPVKVGDNDRCIVWVALGDWDYRRFGGSPQCPVEINTTDKSSFFDRNSEAVIAYGEYVSDRSTDGWIKVEIPLQYSSHSRRPTHIIVSAAASMLGDYFTGSEDSILWLDDLRLEY